MVDNTTAIWSYLPLASIYTAVVVLVLVIAVTLIGDLLLLFVICKDKRLQRPLYILLANILVGDVLFVAISLPLNVTTFLHNGIPFGSEVCYFQAYVTYVTISASACILTSIALYRLFQVCYVHLYVRMVSWKWLTSAAGVSWLIPIALCAILGGQATFDPLKYSCQFTDIKLIYVAVICFYVPMVVTVICSYVKIYHYTRKSQRRIESNVTSQNPDILNFKPTKKKDEVVFRMMLLIFLEFLFFYIGPGTINAVLSYVRIEIRFHLSLVAFMLFRTRPAANCFTYLVTNVELRNETSRMKTFFNFRSSNNTSGQGPTLESKV